MTGFRFVLACVLTIAVTQTGLAQTKIKRKAAVRPADQNSVVYKVYSLAEMSNDPSLGAWIADTIPKVIQPGSWSVAQKEPQVGPYGSPLPTLPIPAGISYYQPLKTSDDEKAKGALSYYAPGRVLVVNHTVAVHAQIDLFLKNVKTALPTAKRAEPAPVAPAQYTVPNRVPESVAYNKSTAYPVPAPLAQPKHLFHFIIRYEGDGVIDANIADVVKAIYSEGSANNDKSEKPTAAPAKSPSLSQLFNFIIRYEGDGIVDSNVVELVKAMTAQKQAESGATLPSAMYLQTPPSFSPGLTPAGTVNFGTRPMPPADPLLSAPAPRLGPQPMAVPVTPNRTPMTIAY